MSRPRWLAGIAAAIAIYAALPGPAMAGPATERVREFFGDVNQVITDPAPDRRLEDRLGAMRALVTGMIEFREAARIALGAEWTARTPAQQDQFVSLFADLLQTSVFGAVGGRARFHNGLTVTYIGELAEQGGVTVVTTILARSGNEIAVGYRMTSRDGAWKVYDVVLDGVSLVENYRAQFTKVIQRLSYAGLVGEMRARLVDLGHGTALASLPVPSETSTVPPSPEPLVALKSEQEEVPVTARADQPSAVAAPPMLAHDAVAIGEEVIGRTAARDPVNGGLAEPDVANVRVGSPNGRVPEADGLAGRIGRTTRPTEPERVGGRLAALEPVNGRLAVSERASTAPTDAVNTRLAEPAAGAIVTARPRVAARAADAAPPAPARIRPTVEARPTLAPAYWVQVGAFRTDEAAIKVVTALADEEIALLRTPDAPWLRVLVGPFANRSAAVTKLREIRARGFDAFVAELAR